MAVAKVTKNGRVQWRARIVVDGKQRVAYRRTKAEALDAEAELRRARKLPERGVEDPTYSEFWPRVVRYCTTASRRPWKAGTQSAKAVAHNRVLPHLGGLRLTEIDESVIDRLAMELSSTYERSTIANTLAVVLLVLNLAKRWGILDRVPKVESTAPPPSKVGADEWFTEQDLGRLLAELRPHWQAVVLVAARTGLRVGELQALRWSDVDLERRQLHVRRTWVPASRGFGPPKNGRPRTVPLPPDAVAVLTERQGEGDGLVFDHGRSGVFSLMGYTGALARACKRAGLRKRSGSHVMRHTWASHCVLAGVNSRAIMMVAGWTSEALLARYAHLRVEDFAGQFDRLGVTAGVTRGRKRPAKGAEVPLLQ